jgi:hypothetical protein
MNLLLGLSNSGFEWAARNSVRASVLIALVLALQKLLGTRLTAGMRHALSLLVLLGLLLPMAPPSALSLANWIPRPSRAPTPVLSSGGPRVGRVRWSQARLKPRRLVYPQCR